MFESMIEPGMEIKSNTVYYGRRDRYDIRIADTVRCEDKTYLSVHEDHYGFLSAAFLLRSLENVTLDFRGARIVLHGRIQPFIIDDCRNVTIRNCTIEYDRSFFTEAKVMGMSDGQMCVRLCDSFPCRVGDGYLVPYAETWENHDLNKGDMFVQCFDSETGEGRSLIVGIIGEIVYPRENAPAVVKQLRVRGEGDNIIFTGDFPQSWSRGMTVVFAHEKRDKTSVTICRSEDCKIENYRILNGAGMGIYAMHTRNIRLDGLSLYRDALSHGIVTNAADAVHTVACSGDIVIENSVFEGTIDDAINIHSNFYTAVTTNGVVLTAEKTKISHCLNVHCTVFARGDKIAVYNGKTMERRDVYLIENVSLLDDYRIAMSLDRPAGIAAEGDLIENLSAQANLTIRNCRFGKSNAHLRLQTRGRIVIENCEIDLPVMLTGDTTYWFEASPVDDLTVRDCVFTGRGCISIIPDFTPVPAAPMHNIFTCAVPVDGHGAERVVFRENKGIGSMHLQLHDCGEVDADIPVTRG